MRGNWRDAIFLHGADYQRFVDQLAEALHKDNVVLYAYALMPNHYHLLVETPNANLSRFLQRLNTAYSLYYRYKHQRPGHAFQGRYGAKLVQGDQYILALTRYIHLNPVKVKSVIELDAHWKLEHLMSYEWTSYKGYVDPKRVEPMVDYRWLNLMGGKSDEDNRRLYRKYIEAMLLKCDQKLLDALHADEEVIGGEDGAEGGAAPESGVRLSTVERVRSTVESRHRILADTGATFNPDAMDAMVAKAFGVRPEDLALHGNRAGVAKSVAIELFCRFGKVSQTEAGKRYGNMTCAAVGQQRKRLYAKLRSDKTLQEQYRGILNACRRWQCQAIKI